MPKVSVIIPVYNTEKYLEKCLSSVCNQTLKDIEIICIDDCSTDNSLNILKEYASKDERIKLIEFKENKGAAAARNTGMIEACGEYIGFVDSDDYIDLNFYQLLYSSIAKNDADASKGKLILKEVEYNIDKDTTYDTNDLVANNFAYFYHSFTTGLYKQSFLKDNKIKFLENCQYFEDPYFSINAILHYSKVVIENKAKYYYVINENSACSNYSPKKRMHDEKFAILEVVNMINASNISFKRYLIIFNYLVRHVMFLNSLLNKDNAHDFLSLCLDLYKNCKYPDEQIEFFFNEKELFQTRYAKKKRLYDMRKGISR